MPRRRAALTAVSVAVVLASVPVATTPTSADLAPTAPVRLAAVPAGFDDQFVASVDSPTTIEVLPDGRVVVLEQDGDMRLIVGNTLRPGAALRLNVCDNSERGLLGFTHDPEFLVNRHVYVYYTRPAPSFPGNCVNRVSRFTMVGDTVDVASEIVLVDNISSVAGNHNGGDLDIGKDGHLYIAVGDAGSDPRGNSGSGGNNDAARDLSLLNGKILRVDRRTGQSPPDNPLVAQGAVECRTRGNVPSTPTTPCAEIYAWGLRNPFRFAFDPNVGPQRFFINDVGQSAREEVNEGGPGRDYGWNVREGICPRGQQPPCAGPPAGMTDPITDYPRQYGTYITAGAFVPDGVWPAEYDGAYLFGDGGSGHIYVRRADGSVDYDQPFATQAFGITDMTFVREGFGVSLWYTVPGGVRKIVRPFEQPAASGPLQFVPNTPIRIHDSRDSSTGGTPLAAGVPRSILTPVDGTTTRAVLVSLAYVGPTTDGFVTAWAARAPQPSTANVNARSGEVVSNMAIVPVDETGRILLYSIANAHVVIDLLGRFDEVDGPVRAGRFRPVDPTRLADTREPFAVDTNEFTRVPGSPLPRVRVPVLGRGGVPDSGVASVVLVVTGLSGANPGGGYLTATAGGAPWSGSANLNTNGNGDIRPNTVVVPVGSDGTVDLHLFSIADVVVDVAGWFTDDTAASSTAGRFISLPPTREVDTRIPLGFDRIAATEVSTHDPVSVPANAAGLAQNMAIVDNAAEGFLTPFPEPPLPLVAAGNVTAPGQVRSILTFTKLSATGTMSYYTIMDTDLVVDVTGYFQG